MNPVHPWPPRRRREVTFTGLAAWAFLAAAAGLYIAFLASLVGVVIVTLRVLGVSV